MPAKKTKTALAAGQKVQVNRAPVLTLWASVVARRLGYKQDEALTLGRAVAGLNAQSKGRRLGIFKPKEKSEEAEKSKAEAKGAEERVEVCGRSVLTKRTAKGVRAVAGGRVIEPSSVEGYLRRSFGDDLDAVRQAMTELAKAYKPKDLEPVAYELYERFRPAIPGGSKGWGARGELDLGLVQSLTPG
jgi:hypothetical protein